MIIWQFFLLLKIDKLGNGKVLGLTSSQVERTYQNFLACNQKVHLFFRPANLESLKEALFAVGRKGDTLFTVQWLTVFTSAASSFSEGNEKLSNYLDMYSEKAEQMRPLLEKVMRFFDNRGCDLSAVDEFMRCSFPESLSPWGEASSRSLIGQGEEKGRYDDVPSSRSDC